MTINARKQQSNGYGRSSPTCKFCSTQGHTMTKCPDMIKLYEEVKDKPIAQRGFKGNYAVQYLDKKKGITKSGTKIKKAKKCGYCRETGHNRRECSQMVEDKALIIKANKVWRRLWADFSSKFGLTPASLIKVHDRRYDYSKGGYITNEYLCTVGAELPENLNVFALGSDSKQQEIRLPLLGYKPEYGSNIINARSLVKSISENMASSLFSYSYSWGNIERVEVVGSSSYEFTDEWFDQSPTEDIDYALKKWTQVQMHDFTSKCKDLVSNFGGKYGIS